VKIANCNERKKEEKILQFIVFPQIQKHPPLGTKKGIYKEKRVNIKRK